MVLGDVGINTISDANLILFIICRSSIQAEKPTNEEGGMNMEIMNEINWALIAPLIILQVILMVFALVSCLKQEETNGPKWMWILMILFLNMLGPVLYFLVGRKNK